MREFERAVGKTTLLARCDPRLEAQVDWLLRALAKVISTTPFREGMTVQVGWTRFSLRTQAGHVIACEPAFHGNPFTQSNQDVTLSLAVLAAHDEMVHALGVESEAVSFHQSVLIRRDSLSERQVRMARKSKATGDESGWTVGLDALGEGNGGAEDEGEGLELIRTTELLRVRRSLVVPLVLPVGWTVAWDGDTVDSIRDATKADRWTPRAAEVLRENLSRLEWAWRHPTGRSVPPS